MALIAAVLRAQWLSMRSFRLQSRRRWAALSMITALIWYGFWTMIAFTAEETAANAELKGFIETGLAPAVLLIFLYWQLAPLVSASMGSSLDLKKLAIYPVPHRDLFSIEVLLRLTTCVEMVLVLMGIVTGLFRNPFYGGLAAIPRLLMAFAIFLSFNLLLAAGTRSLVERLLRQRRLREILMLLFVLVAALPQLLLTIGTPAGPWKTALLRSSWPFLPWGAFSNLALGQRVFTPLAVLLIWTAAAGYFGRRQFERSLRFDAAEQPLSSGATRSRMDLAAFPGLFLPDPLAAMVEKELRSLARTPRFRVVFVMGFSFGLLIWLPMKLRHSATGSTISRHFLTIVCLYALILLGQVSYMNALGFDRSAAQVYYSLPVPVSQALAGKNAAAAIFTLLEMLLLTAICLLLGLPSLLSEAPEAYLVTAVVALYLFAAGNLSSVHFPRAMNPEHMSGAGAAGRMQALLFFLYPLALLPVALAFWARYVFESEGAFYLVLGLAAVIGAVFYWIAMDSAAHAAVRRRELIMTELSRGVGPVVAE